MVSMYIMHPSYLLYTEETGICCQLDLLLVCLVTNYRLSHEMARKVPEDQERFFPTYQEGGECGVLQGNWLFIVSL